jgi:diguanylate cyclase (GGDEF)-like protein
MTIFDRIFYNRRRTVLVLAGAMLVILALCMFSILREVRFVTGDLDLISKTLRIREIVRHLAAEPGVLDLSQPSVREVDEIFKDIFLQMASDKGSRKKFLATFKKMMAGWESFKSDRKGQGKVSDPDHDMDNDSDAGETNLRTAIDDLDFYLQVRSETRMHLFGFLVVFGIAVTAFTFMLALVFFNTVYRKMDFFATYDPLTKILNRTSWRLFAEQELERFERQGRAFSLVMYDIDHFKKVNDTWGHKTGDAVLVNTVQLVSSVIRKSDLHFRVGGEEFVVLLKETPRHTAAMLAEKIRAEVAGCKHCGEFRVTISIGVTEAVKGDTPDSIMNRVDVALYKAKDNGRDRVETG